VLRVAQAINIQIARHLTPLWGVSGTVMALESANNLDPGIWPVYVTDDAGTDAAGFHLTEHNQPFAIVQTGDTWSVTASHEILEMLVDPSGNRLVPAAAVAIIDNEVQDTAGKFEYLVEICDPPEGEQNGYLIDDVLVSDFYTPSYFDPAGTVGSRYSYSGRITRPRQVLPNGYLTWYNPQTNKLQQVRHFGAPEIVDLGTGKPGQGSITGGRSLRSFVDSLTRPPRPLSRLPESTPSVLRRDERRLFFASAAPARGTMFTAALKRVVEAQQAASPPSPAPQELAALVAQNLDSFRKAGVLSVRPGLRWGIQGPNGEQVIVVNAVPDAVASLTTSLPRTIGNTPVDIRPAGSMEAMRALQPARYLAVAAARHELRQPDFPSETFFDGKGTALAQSPAPLQAFAAGHAAKPEIPYVPADASLGVVEGKPVTLILHASPDAGWAELSAFLAGVEQDLVVGMYDFTSAHVLAAVTTALSGGKSLTLTLDHPATNPTANQTDDQTQANLSSALGGKFEGAWALTETDPKAPVWIYPNAYHIKVAVREDDTFWLSSGNWNNSNQPVIDLSDIPAAKKIAAKSDRDWHVIVTSKELANTFRAFLKNDFSVAKAKGALYTSPAATAALQANTPIAANQFVVPADALAAGRMPQQFFPPKTISGEIQIQPLLTPDNYQPNVLDLIKSAKRTFYMQTQYIHPSGNPRDKGHDDLIAAVKDLIDKGVDVRLITSQFQTDAWVEKLVGAGIPTSVLRRQTGVHNKGIVVDSDVVMVSSQNWSADGTLRNRDAGLIIHDPEAAAYFEQIFLHDWNHLASPISG